MAGKSSRRYDTLLRVRKRQEDLKAQAAGEARRAHLALRREQRHLEERRRALLTMADTPPGAAINPVRLEGVYQYDRHMARVIDTKNTEILEHGRKVSEAEAELESAMGRRRIMEKLIERAERAERWRFVRREQQEHDEFSVMRHAHAQRHGAKARDHVADIRNRGAGDHRLFSGADHPAGG